MFVWIVWGEAGPMAVFSSEQRARDYIGRHEAEAHWSCSRACVNVEDGFRFGAALPQPVSHSVLTLN